MNVLYKIAYLRSKIKEFAGAINDFTVLIEKGSRKSESYFYRGNCYFLLREYIQAISDYSAAIEEEPDNAEVYYNRVYAYFRNKQYDNAIKDWEICIALKESYRKELEGKIKIASEILKTKK